MASKTKCHARGLRAPKKRGGHCGKRLKHHKKR